MPFVASPAGPIQFATTPEKTRRPIRYFISGVTKNSAGVALGGCEIRAYEAVSGGITSEPKGRLVNRTDSDANGNYSIEVHADPAVTFKIDAYLPGATPVAGTTLRTLTPTAT